MKTYEEFIQEAYTKTYGDIDEGWGAAARWGGRALRGVPGLQTAIGLGVAAHRLYKGDKTGAALAAGSAIPGPVGYGFLGADIAREVGKYQQSQKAEKPKPAAPKPSDSSPTPTAPKPPSSSPTPAAPKPAAAPSQPAKPVLSKLGGVEGTGVGKDFVASKGGWKASEKERYEKYKTKV